MPGDAQRDQLNGSEFITRNMRVVESASNTPHVVLCDVCTEVVCCVRGTNSVHFPMRAVHNYHVEIVQYIMATIPCTWYMPHAADDKFLPRVNVFALETCPFASVCWKRRVFYSNPN